MTVSENGTVITGRPSASVTSNAQANQSGTAHAGDQVPGHGEHVGADLHGSREFVALRVARQVARAGRMPEVEEVLRHQLPSIRRAYPASGVP